MVARPTRDHQAPQQRYEGQAGNGEAPSEHPGAEHPARIARFRWANTLLSVALILVIAVPTMALEESWYGRPMIDQHSHLWLIPAGVVVLAFFLGGLVSAFRLPSAPVVDSALVGAAAVGVLVLGALIRRFLFVHDGLPPDVVQLWIGGAVVAVALTMAGAGLGRRLARR
jgi:hypothetical protein